MLSFPQHEFPDSDATFVLSQYHGAPNTAFTVIWTLHHWQQLRSWPTARFEILSTYFTPFPLCPSRHQHLHQVSISSLSAFSVASLGQRWCVHLQRGSDRILYFYSYNDNSQHPYKRKVCFLSFCIIFVSSKKSFIMNTFENKLHWWNKLFELTM